MVNGKCFEQNLNDFLELFSKKVQTSYSGRLRAPAVHGVSSYFNNKMYFFEPNECTTSQMLIIELNLIRFPILK